MAFLLAVPFIQGALFATMNTGTDLARDIETGFMNRLSLTPMRGVALLLGQLGGDVVLGLFQALAYIAVGLIAGVRFGPASAGVLVLLVFYTLIVLGVRRARRCSRRSAPARARRCRACSRSFFVFLFISSMAIPRNLMHVDWFR